MATKTVVCPECGSTAAPGRYACAECGALLAAVALTPRGWTADDGDPSRSGNRAAGNPGDVVDEPVAANVPPMISGSAIDGAASPAAAASPGGPEAPVDANPAGSLAFDEDAPLESAQESLEIDASVKPDLLHDLEDEPEPEESSVDAQPREAVPAGDEPDPLAVGSSWPPLGDRGPMPPPTARTPAGSYLPPSAILPPGDGLLMGGDQTGPAGARPGSNGSTAVPAAQPASWAPGPSLLQGASAALTEAFDSIRTTADASRRAVAVGAGIATLGLFLPWVGSLPGANAFTGYLDRWGLAGPGMWLVLLGLLVLIAVAGSPGATATWPVGLVAVATASFLVGLVWPYLVGSFSRSIGVWVILVGAVVLAVAGILDRRPRHDGEEPPV